MSGNYENIKFRDPSQKVPEEFIEGLQQNGIQEEGYDWFRAGFYIKGLSDSGDIKHAIEYLASGYAVARQHIEDYFTGEEKAGQLRKSMASGMKSNTGASGQYYTLDELGKTKGMVDEIKKYMPGSSDGRHIGVGLSEEDIGVRLTELALKGKLFDQCSDVSQKLKNAVTGSIDNIIRETGMSNGSTPSAPWRIPGISLSQNIQPIRGFC